MTVLQFTGAPTWRVHQPKPARFPAYTVENLLGDCISVPIMAHGQSGEIAIHIAEALNVYGETGKGPRMMHHESQAWGEMTAKLMTERDGLKNRMVDLMQAAKAVERILAPYVDAKMSAAHMIEAVERLRIVMRDAEGQP